METTISLKTLRTNPRRLVDLFYAGKPFVITEHRRELARFKPVSKTTKHKKGSAEAVLEAIKKLPPIETPFPEEDTVALMKRTRLEYLERKYGYRK